jgi:hypothetical protein
LGEKSWAQWWENRITLVSSIDCSSRKKLLSIL